MCVSVSVSACVCVCVCLCVLRCSNRKGKLIILYDWTIKANVTGATSDKVDFKATINIPNLSDENEIDEVDVSVNH